MTRAQKTDSGPDSLELIATAVSALLLAALIGFLVWDAFQPLRPAEFETVVGAPERRGSQLYVPVAVRNLGDEAARVVEVEVRVAGAPSGFEGRFTIDWLPGRSTRRGIAVFSAVPTEGQFAASIRGYAEP